METKRPDAQSGLFDTASTHRREAIVSRETIWRFSTNVSRETFRRLARCGEGSKTLQRKLRQKAKSAHGNEFAKFLRYFIKSTIEEVLAEATRPYSVVFTTEYGRVERFQAKD